MNLKSINNSFFVLGNVIVFFLVFLNSENSFFWDTIQLASKHANYYLSSNFSNLLLPNEIDSGHIPTFGLYIAFIWKIFGRTLYASHLSMLPFAIGIVWQLNYLCIRFIPNKYAGLALILILIDPTLMSQITLVSPDIPLMFFFLLALNSIFNNRQLLLGLSIFLLFLTSMRGMMISVCLLIIDIYCNFNYEKKGKISVLKNIIKRFLMYLPALILFMTFSFYHYHEKGWIGFHKNSPWADCFKKVDFKGFLFNIALLGWRILDFGRIVIWFVFIILSFKYKIINNKKNHLLFLIFTVILVVLPLNMLWATNLIGHRYLMPIYVTFSILTASILFADYVENKVRIILTSIWVIVILSGNFWIYPSKIATGWDSTLSYFPYYKLRLQAISYLDLNKINYKNVDSFFPNTATFDEIDLKNDLRFFDTYIDGNNSEYLFYSNVFNINDQTHDNIFKNYKPVKKFHNKGVYIIILKKRNYSSCQIEK